MFKDLVHDLLEDALEKRNDLFLIDFEILSDNSIRVVIDGDNGVTVEDCMFISRAIEHNLDRDEHDFSLEVTSAGATSPLTHLRQYKKNVGRVIEVFTINDEKFEGSLAKVTENFILLEWKAREPKPTGKGKVTVQKQAEIAYDDIKSASVIIKF